MTCGIYELIFKGLEDFPYVGQSKCIENRYREHINRFKSKRCSKLFLEAYDMCGIPSMHVLEECPEYELYTKETYYINKLDCINNGLNVLTGGFGPGSGTQHSCSKYTKEQILLALNLLCDTQLSIKEVEEQSKVTVRTIRAVCGGQRHSWVGTEYPDLIQKVRKINKIRLSENISKACKNIVKKEYLPILSPNNTLIQIPGTLKDFCINNGLNQGMMSRVMSGKVKEHRGWRLPCTNTELALN